MPKIIIIEKNGTVKTATVKEFTEDTLYKKAGLKVGDGFMLQHTWGAEDGLDQSIKLYGKKTGRAGQENKYDFPPPIDNILFFGPCVLVGSDLVTGKIVDLKDTDWEEFYEYLFGGFDNVGSDDSDDDEEVTTDDEINKIQNANNIVVKQTKQGYEKDGFIVDDEEDDSSELSSSDDDAIPIKTLVKKSVLTPLLLSVSEKPVVESDMQIDDCESELSEESYL